MPHAKEVNVHDPARISFAALRYRAANADAGVIHHQMDPAEPVPGKVGEGRHRLTAGDITHRSHGAISQPICRLVNSSLMRIGQNDLAALADQHFRNAEANAAGGAGHDADFARWLERPGHGLPPHRGHWPIEGRMKAELTDSVRGTQ